jgi:hypothetical protein
MSQPVDSWAPGFPDCLPGLAWFFTPLLGAKASAARRSAGEPKSRFMIVAPLWITGPDLCHWFDDRLAAAARLTSSDFV